MKHQLVITLTGADRVGLVEHITKILLDYNANVDASRMAHLGGEFAMLALVSVPAENFKSLQQGFTALEKEGFQVTCKPTNTATTSQYSGWLPYHLTVHGADHEGIIHHITQYLADLGINIETMDTNMVQAPMSGTPLFTMDAIIVVPPHLHFHEWSSKLEETGDQVNVNADVSPYTG